MNSQGLWLKFDGQHLLPTPQRRKEESVFQLEPWTAEGEVMHLEPWTQAGAICYISLILFKTL